MNHYFHQPASTSQSARPEKCPPLPPCPECGGLVCLCRPRFFAGQLLTEEDLNRLEHYIIEKNKLHNRYLHGWGVVCGLEVVCSPCHNMVDVKPGYALSPCGEDIVVCRDETVDVCALIQKCKPADRSPDCDPLRSHSDVDCKDVIEDWILAICYDEKSSRGITALRGGSGGTSCSRCNCGGSSSCGCDCHTGAKTNGNVQNAYKSATRNSPPQCEPTVICEGYSFIAYKAPPKNPIDEKRPLQGEWGERFMECVSTLTSFLSKIPANATNDQLHTWFYEFKAALLDFFTKYPTHDCSLYERLTQVTLPAPATFNSSADYQQAFELASNRMTAIAAEYWRHCLCATLFPPCPEPVECNCVPLATIKIRKSDCRILQVCNFGPRRLVVTFPHLEYWLSPSGLLETLRAAIEKLCCDSFREKSIRIAGRNISTEAPVTNVSTAAVSVPVSTTTENTFASLFSQSWLNKTRTIDAQTLMLAALGFVDDKNNPFANNVEFDNALSFLLLNQAIRPSLETVLPSELSGLLELLARQKNRGTVTETVVMGESNEIVALRNMVEELQKTVQRQGEQIASLKKTGK